MNAAHKTVFLSRTLLGTNTRCTATFRARVERCGLPVVYEGFRLPSCCPAPLHFFVPQVQSWKKEIEDEEQLLRAQRRADNAKRRKERADDSLKRGERYVTTGALLTPGYLIQRTQHPPLSAFGEPKHCRGDHEALPGSKQSIVR